MPNPLPQRLDPRPRWPVFRCPSLAGFGCPPRSETTYDAVGRVLTQRDQRGFTTRFAYGAGTTTTTDPLGNGTLKLEDADGQVTEERDALRRVTRFRYDLASSGPHGQGRLLQVDHPDGTITTNVYDAAGRKVRETDELGQTTAFGFDALGHLTSVTDALGAITRFGYDEVGNRISIADTNGHLTRFEYDGMGRMTGRVLQGGKSESMGYDAMGALTSKTDFNGHTSVFAYDQAGRMRSRAYADQASETFSYSPLGRRLTAGNESFTFDAQGRVLTNTKPSGETLSYAYDAAGNRTAVSARAACVRRVGPGGWKTPRSISSKTSCPADRSDKAVLPSRLNEWELNRLFDVHRRAEFMGSSV